MDTNFLIITVLALWVGILQTIVFKLDKKVDKLSKKLNP